MEENFAIYSQKEMKKFIKAITGHKYECFYKLIFAYRLSRTELLNLEWNDINFEENTIKIYPITYIPNETKNRYTWGYDKVEKFSRTYPLLPHLKDLLKEELKKQTKNSLNKENYNHNFANYVCLKENGERLNDKTLSRNVKYIARDNNLPELVLPTLRKSVQDFFIMRSKNYDYYCCWERIDIFQRKENCYPNVNLCRNQRFITALNNLIDQNQSNAVKGEFEMWGALWIN